MEPVVIEFIVDVSKALVGLWVSAIFVLWGLSLILKGEN